MNIDLKDIKFTNDIFSTMLPSGDILILNKVEEDFSSIYGESVVRAINIEVHDVDDNIINCPCIIGLGNDIMQIKTDYKEYEGDVLTPDNMEYCTIEIYD